MTPEEFRKYGYQIIDWIAEYRTNVGKYPVMSTVQPGTVRDALPVTPPESPVPFDAVMQDLDRVILPGVTH